jgi:hypothetical protein
MKDAGSPEKSIDRRLKRSLTYKKPTDDVGYTR